MAFTDPIEWSYDEGVTEIPLPRTSTGQNLGIYTVGNGTLAVRAEHTYARRTRRLFRVDFNKMTPDPFIPSQNVKVTSSLYVVSDQPAVGFSNEEIEANYKAMNFALERDSDKLLKAWLSGQS
jgi:hypothetical protein